MLDRTPTLVADGMSIIQVHGVLLDRDRNPVPDAVLEFCSSGHRGTIEHAGFPRGFRRAPTDDAGRFIAIIERPIALAEDRVQMQAPHLAVSVFMRGLLRHLLTRVYFADDAGLASDKVLQAISNDRRATLIAQVDSRSVGTYRWDVILQGEAETVFFAW